MSDVWTVRRLLTWTTGHFEKKGVDSPRLTSEILLAHVLKLNRVRLYVDLDRPLEKSELTELRALIEKRAGGTPTQYLVGHKEFYNRRFRVDARVLIPRPETELLVDHVLQALPKAPAKVPAAPTAEGAADGAPEDGDAPAAAAPAPAASPPAAPPPAAPPPAPRVLDVCTGSGCIAVTVAAERPLAQVWATDLSEGACALARENAEALGVGGRLAVLQGDLFAPLPPDARFDVVVSNPPYIATGELAGLQLEVRQEPRLALDGGPDGLALVRRVVEGARERLVPGGLLAMEIGEDQGAAVHALLTAAGYAQVRVAKDLERRDRFALGCRPAV
jgi:release factor glutamine methyltransferase